MFLFYVYMYLFFPLSPPCYSLYLISLLLTFIISLFLVLLPISFPYSIPLSYLYISILPSPRYFLYHLIISFIPIYFSILSPPIPSLLSSLLYTHPSYLS